MKLSLAAIKADASVSWPMGSDCSTIILPLASRASDSTRSPLNSTRLLPSGVVVVARTLSAKALALGRQVAKGLRFDAIQPARQIAEDAGRILGCIRHFLASPVDFEDPVTGMANVLSPRRSSSIISIGGSGPSSAFQRFLRELRRRSEHPSHRLHQPGRSWTVDRRRA